MNKIYPKQMGTVALTLLALIALSVPAEAAAATTSARMPVGDIILRGTVARSGGRIATDSTIFEGDTIRTQKASDGVIRVGKGRIEIAESSEVEIVRQSPLKIVVKSGAIAFNFPKGTNFEIITPQLEIRPRPGETSLSGSVTAEVQKEDRVLSRSGNFTVLEREPNGQTSYIRPEEILVASLVMPVPLEVATPMAAVPQGPIGGPQIATLTAVNGDVRVGRAATLGTQVRITAPGLQLANGDLVRTLQGRAEVTFNDKSIIKLDLGTVVSIAERPAPGGFLRSISQSIGTLWFNVQRVTGTRTNLSTPTAVAAIRGTTGLQEVPNDTQSTHALEEGIEDITEIVTQQTVTIRDRQRVTAIRGVGFTPVVALLAALTQPAIGAGGGGGGGAAGGGGGGVAGGGAGAASSTASAAGISTASTVSTVATVTAVSVTTATTVIAATAPLLDKEQPRASGSLPLDTPGGGS